ncbi:TIGR00730 family Rossman fold protein [Amnibacterium sp. CER49]|uniref:LOG family protein n=1 Tax=Amnibacterium sp. CER49 TaxID=3039161 RepID=UPI00244C14A6|nr:TIGR00730 family Rossman fold protein [Amnibacterium sp. CER49]MDH2444225.1 TIGR00730 family Rossman fold protein [Amnibacterium sp. CER49]
MLGSVAVFCGSSPGLDEVYLDAARAVGRSLAGRGITVVYGGGGVGLMGAVASAAVDAGGRVIGVIPEALVDREAASPELAELHVVQTMHERKAMMADLADAFVALPGGPGTLEEIAEQWTWAQIGVHRKPCGFLDVAGYWSPLEAMVARMVDQGFVRPHHAGLVTFSDSLDALLEAFAQAPPAPPAAPPPPV